MKLPASVRAAIAQAAAPIKQDAIVIKPKAALTQVIEDEYALTTREDRLAWLRDFATGKMRFPKYVRGMQTQVPADAPLRLRAVETISRIEGDLKDAGVNFNIGQAVLLMPSNGREREVIDAEPADEDEEV